MVVLLVSEESRSFVTNGKLRMEHLRSWWTGRGEGSISLHGT